MGYTHYFSRPQKLDRTKFQAAAEDCRRIREALQIPLCRYYDDTDRPLFTADTISFNGVGDDGHETLYVEREFKPAKWQEPDRHGSYFAFCKTARKPYDLAVQCCLIVMQHHLGEIFAISSDGDYEEWWDARDRCHEVLGYGAVKLSETVVAD